jgi:GT2 family glycosyltransferase
MQNLTIVIVNWNTKESLRECLASLRDHAPLDSTRVIVVDNASSDGSRDMVGAEFPFTELINSGGNIGFGRANNIALRKAATPLVLLLNPDIVVPEGTLPRMLEFMSAHPDVGALQCKLLYENGESQTLGIQWNLNPLNVLLTLAFVNDRVASACRGLIPYHDPEKSGYVKMIAGGCMLVRKSVLDTVGHFDERFFMYAEDGDLCRRIIDGGWKIYYLSEAGMRHTLGISAKKAHKNFSTLMQCESVEKLMGKYYGTPGKLLYRAGVLAIGFAKSLALIIAAAAGKGRGTNSREKYRAMVRWSLLLEHPRISG